METYLDDISRHALLSKSDEQRLAEAIEAGRMASKELEEGNGRLPPNRGRQLRALIAACERSTRLFIVSNLRPVVSIAKRYRNSGVALPDLIQEGNSASSRPSASSTTAGACASRPTPPSGSARPSGC